MLCHATCWQPGWPRVEETSTWGESCPGRRLLQKVFTHRYLAVARLNTDGPPGLLNPLLNCTLQFPTVRQHSLPKSFESCTQQSKLFCAVSPVVSMLPLCVSLGEIHTPIESA